MPPLDFPASPSVNQTYSGPGGVVWVWDGAKWVSGTGSTVYAPVTSPVFLGNPTAPNPPAGDADTSVATTSFVAAAVGTALHDTGRNLLHNPLFNVSQRGAGPWTTAGMTLDRWRLGFTLDAASVSRGTLGDTHRAQMGDEAATFSLVNVFTGNAGATANNVISQAIEDVRRLAGKTMTISFYAIASTGLKLGVSFLQYFGTGGSPSANVTILGQSVTLTTTYARYSLTFAIPSISGATLGTAGDNSTNVYFWFSSGANSNATSGSVGVQSGTINLWGVQLEIGSVTTPLDKPYDYGADLRNCQRFYQTGQFFMAAAGANGATFGGVVSFPNAMRAAPAIVFVAPGLTNCTSLTAGQITANSFICYATTSSAAYTGINTNLTASADL